MKTVNELNKGLKYQMLIDKLCIRNGDILFCKDLTLQILNYKKERNIFLGRVLLSNNSAFKNKISHYYKYYFFYYFLTEGIRNLSNEIRSKHD